MTGEINEKRHSACDECRKRKLKCSGDAFGCDRCQREGLSCMYSLRQAMGRPKKRARHEDAAFGVDSYNQESQNIMALHFDPMLGDVVDFSVPLPLGDGLLDLNDPGNFTLLGGLADGLELPDINFDLGHNDQISGPGLFVSSSVDCGTYLLILR